MEINNLTLFVEISKVSGMISHCVSAKHNCVYYFPLAMEFHSEIQDPAHVLLGVRRVDLPCCESMLAKRSTHHSGSRAWF